jgi:uncharacterized protein YndB with AHSA1/START domain
VSVVDASVEIEASPKRVWEVVADPTNLPNWDHHIVAVEGVPSGGLTEGARYVTWVRFMGVRARAEVEVETLRPERYAKTRLGGILEGTVETWLDPLGDQRTRLRHRIEYSFIGGPLGRMAARGVKLLGASLLLRRGTLAQKRQVESERG